MIDLKEKFGSTENNGDLKEHFSKARKYISVSVNKNNKLVEPTEDSCCYCVLPGTRFG